MEVKKVLNIALRSGEILLISGSETYRVEDTISRICNAYNIECESFVTPTGIFISGHSSDSDESVSLIKRIQDRTINLHNIEIINTFSRNLQKNLLSYNEAMEILNSIKTESYFSFKKRL